MLSKKLPRKNLLRKLPGLFLLLALSPLAWAWQDTLRLCYEEEDYPPFIGPTTPANSALLIDLISSAAERSQLKLAWYRRPWKRCIQELQQGQADGVFAAIWLPERDSWGVFPGRQSGLATPDRRYRLWQVDYPILTRMGSGLSWDGERFTGVNRGLTAPLGYVAQQRLGTLGVLSKASHTAEKALRLVASGRLDGYVVERQIGLSLIHKLGLDGRVQMLPLPLMTADWHLPLSHQFVKRHPDLSARFWQSLGEERERRLKELTQRYLKP